MAGYQSVCSMGELGIVALSSCTELGAMVNEQVKLRRKEKGMPCLDTFLIPADEIRFSNGEAKTKILESVRGRDVYILCDPGNYGVTYDFYGQKNRKSPDDHFQDLKRAVGAVCGKAKRTTVVMPLMYESRQDRRRGRESLDCAVALQELSRMGVQDIITFDLHDSRVQNAVPLASFENLFATYGIVMMFMNDEREVAMDNQNLLVISPDSGGMDRAIYYAGVLDTDVGMFYKRRDYTRVENGKNPIIQHDYLGQTSLEGKNVLIIDDILATGDGLIDVAEELKRRGVKKIFISVTFALFTKGYERFHDLHKRGVIERIYSTNLTYVPEERKDFPWYKEVDMSQQVANFIDTLNHDASIEPLIDATDSLKAHIKELRKNAAAAEKQLTLFG